MAVVTGATTDAIALKVAAGVIADAAKAISGTFSREIPEAIKVYMGAGSNVAFIAAGTPTGRWGWTPIHAWMFETPGARHPLFGDRKRWYVQPYRPFMEEAAEAKGQAAAERYADIEIMFLAKAHGYK